MSTATLRPSKTERACHHDTDAAMQNRTCACFHHNVASIQNRMCACVITTTWVALHTWHPTGCVLCHHDTDAARKPNVYTCLHHNVVGTPKPRVRLHGPRGPWSRTLGLRRFGAGTPTGLNKMRYPDESRPDSSPGCNGGRACGDVDGWGHVGPVAPLQGAFSAPHASPGYGPTPCGVGPNPGLWSATTLW